MKTICIFGDSITWGRGLSARVGWANLLRNYLEKKDKLIEVYDLGIDRNTTLDVLKRFDIEADARKPQIIIFAVGINDSVFRKNGTDDISIEQFENNLQKLILKAKIHTDDIIFIGLAKGDDGITCPLKGSTTGKCYSKERVSKFNSSIEKTASMNKVEFLDIASFLNDSDFYDGLHPNEKGHEIIFEKIKSDIEKYL